MERKEIIKLCIDHTAPPDNINEMGILRFGKLFFPERFSQEYAMVHYKMILLFLKLLDPKRANSMDKQSYILVHRSAAKTSIFTFLVPTFLTYLKGYTIVTSRAILDWDPRVDPNKWFKTHDTKKDLVEIKIDEDFIIIASETASNSEDFVLNIRNVLDTDTRLSSIFGEKSPKYLIQDERVGDQTWRRNTFVTSDGTIIRGVGVGQQIRGRNVGGKRPSFIIIDDMYSENNTKTQQARDNLKRWFFNAAVNSLDMEKGKVLWLGTLLHPDTVVKTFRKSDFWFGLEIPIIGTEELTKAISFVKENNGFEQDKFFETKKHMTKLKELEDSFVTMSWREKHSLRLILMKYKELMADNNLNYFYQEFMNEALDPDSKLIQPTSFHRTDIHIYMEEDKQMVEFEYGGLNWKGEVLLYAAMDPASSIATHSDDTAIMVGGMARCYPDVPGIDELATITDDIRGKIFPIITHIEGGKYAIHSYDKLFGMAEALLRLDKRYKLEQIRIEAVGQQMHIVRSIKQYFEQNESFTRIWDIYNTINKQERILSIALPLIQNHKVIICPKTHLIDKLYVQLLTCGVADHDDYADVFAILFKDLKPPEIPQEIKRKQYLFKKNQNMTRYELYDTVIDKNDALFFI